MFVAFSDVWSREPKKGFLPINQGKNGYISEEVARAAYESYKSDQTFERLYERGGFSAIELIYYLYMRLEDYRAYQRRVH